MRLFGLLVPMQGPWAVLLFALAALVLVGLYFAAFSARSSRPANLLYQRRFALIRRIARHVAPSSLSTP